MSVARFTIFDPMMRDLILPGAALEVLQTGMLWAEGPVWFPAGDYLLWSDIPSARLWQWIPELGTRVYSHASNNSNGNTRDRQGRRVTCEHLTRSVVRFEPDGSRTVLADAFDGRRLNSPNDVIVASDGAVWFTDPTYGILSDHEGRRSTPEQPGCFVYRIDPVTGVVDARLRSLKKPNGLALSPDERTLYVADSSRSHDDAAGHHVHGFPVGPDGSLGAGRIVATIEEGVPDGLRVDQFGNLWVSSARGVELFTPEGTLLGLLHLPETATNLTFGGPKNNRLFVTTSTSVYAVYTAVRGAV